ncbi:hypothetical protein AVEN_74782-1 [Araneus ventricosus]|uniref:Uncharacterized protein n=1 Tax=Araneus ventricosus TaxID=182803 RepID=A0A4Y2WEY5_ARAVE|nr:hypothetical protein AVEN_74782-1 [Araneus ventricosus]
MQSERILCLRTVETDQDGSRHTNHVWEDFSKDHLVQPGLIEIMSLSIEPGQIVRLLLSDDIFLKAGQPCLTWLDRNHVLVH